LNLQLVWYQSARSKSKFLCLQFGNLTVACTCSVATAQTIHTHNKYTANIHLPAPLPSHSWELCLWLCLVIVIRAFTCHHCPPYLGGVASGCAWYCKYNSPATTALPTVGVVPVVVLGKNHIYTCHHCPPKLGSVPVVVPGGTAAYHLPSLPPSCGLCQWLCHLIRKHTTCSHCPPNLEQCLWFSRVKTSTCLHCPHLECACERAVGNKCKYLQNTALFELCQWLQWEKHTSEEVPNFTALLCESACESLVGSAITKQTLLSQELGGCQVVVKVRARCVQVPHPLPFPRTGSEPLADWEKHIGK